jgi:hypothetical protein
LLKKNPAPNNANPIRFKNPLDNGRLEGKHGVPKDFNNASVNKQNPKNS